MSDSLRPHGLQHTRLPSPSPTPRAYLNPCPLSRWCHPTISSSVVPFFSQLQSVPASESFLVSQFFASGAQSIGVSASVSVLPMNIQDWFPLQFGFLVAQRLKRLPLMQETWVWSLGQEDPLEKEMVTQSSTLAWRIAWMEKPGGLQSLGSQRVRHDQATSLSLSQHICSFQKKTDMIKCSHCSLWCFRNTLMSSSRQTYF